MPAYDILYLDEDGALACAFTVRFETDMRAKILAHAMRPRECHALEIWNGRDMIYRRPETGHIYGRPETGGALDARRPVAHTARHAPRYIANLA